jgi:hypothetical protein
MHFSGFYLGNGKVYTEFVRIGIAMIVTTVGYPPAKYLLEQLFLTSS